MKKPPSILLAITCLVLVFFAGKWMMNRQDAGQAGPDKKRPGLAPAPILDTVPPSAPQSPVASAAGPPEYVGKQVCGQCHEDNFDSHRRTGHASTFHFTKGWDVAREIAGKSFHDADVYGTFEYGVNEEGLFVTLPDKFGPDPFPLDFALGSGRNGFTFLTLVPGNSGESTGIEHRVTWYTSDNQLDVTPDQEDNSPNQPLELFGEPKRGNDLSECIDCHTTTATVEGDGVANLTANINCEKCHGPGSEHVRLARLSPDPPPFSIGRDDWTAESELQLCASCHGREEILAPTLKGNEYATRLARFQAIGMVRSECLKQSSKSFRCTTCHNPHITTSETTTQQYESICISCHQPDKDDHVVCSVSTTEGCIQCHMPVVKFHRGIAFHDHFIRVYDPDNPRFEDPDE